MKQCPSCKRNLGGRWLNRCYYCQPGRKRSGKDQECEKCGKAFYVPNWEKKKQGPRRYCSQRCHHAAMRGRELVKGSRYVNQQGYVMVKVGIREWKAEHRITMERILGRTLTSNEHVHHKNGNRADNRPKNLQVLSNSEHQKLHDWPRTRSRRVTLKCRHCGTSYERKQSRISRFCSNVCRTAFGRRRKRGS